MVEFIDGPALGQVLCLRRAPKLLRAVRGPRGKWDALDRLGDAPQPNETVYVYARQGRPSHVHLCIHDKKGRPAGGWYAVASYRLCAEQPDDAAARDTALWREWAVAHAATVPTEGERP